MKKNKDYLEQCIEWLLFAFAIIALLVANISVLTRLLKIPLSWSDELLRALFVTIFFIGCAIELKSNGLISITIMEEHLAKKKSPTAYVFLKSFQHIVIAFFSFFSAYEGLLIAISNFQLDKRTAVMNMPSGIIVLMFVIGMTFLGAYSIYVIYRTIRFKKADNSLVSPKNRSK